MLDFLILTFLSGGFASECDLAPIQMQCDVTLVRVLTEWRFEISCKYVKEKF